jgi:hypothetical protein
MRRRKAGLVEAVLAGFAAAVVAVYVAWHPLPDPARRWQPDAPVSVPLAAPAFVLALFWALAGTGRWLLGGRSAGTPLEELLTGVALGTLAASSAALAIGLAGRFTPSHLLGLCVALLVAASRAPPRLACVARALARAVAEAGAAGRAGLVLLAAMVAPALFAALSPPTDVDALMYHLEVPRQFLRAGRIAPETTPQLGHYPLAIQMLFAAGMALAGERTAGLIHAAFSLAALASVAALTRRVVPGAGWLASALLVAGIPHVQRMSGQPVVAMALVFSVVVSTLHLVRWLQHRGRAALVLAALSTGLACGIKHHGLIATFALAVALFVERARSGRPGSGPATARAADPSRGDARCSLRSHAVGPLAAFVAIAALAASPWYVKSAAWTLNPLYPACNRLVHDLGVALGAPASSIAVLSRGWFSREPELAGIDQETTWRFFGRGHGPLDLVALPLWMSVDSAETGPLEPARRYGGEGSPLFLALLPMLLTGGSAGTVLLRPLVVAAAVQAFVVACLAQQIGYFLPVFALLAVPAAAVLARGGRSGRAGLALALVAWLWGMAGTWLASVARGDPPAAVGLVARDRYLAANLDFYESFDWMNRTLPRAARVLLVHRVEAYYLERAYEGADTLRLIGMEAFVRPRTADEFVRALSRRGITHVYVPRHGFALLLALRAGDRHRAMLADLFGGRLARVYSDGRSYVFELPP